MDKLAELNREYWGRIHDMCEGTDVKPWECVKCAGKGDFKDHPKFIFNAECYEFAVAVLENKPVFVGDEVYFKHQDGHKVKVKGITDDGFFVGNLKITNLDCFGDYFTWQPPKPKRTFTLNSVELPCPKQIKPFGFYCDGVFYGFDSFDDAKKVSNQLTKILTEARDKS